MIDVFPILIHCIHLLKVLFTVYKYKHLGSQANYWGCGTLASFFPVWIRKCVKGMYFIMMVTFLPINQFLTLPVLSIQLNITGFTQEGTNLFTYLYPIMCYLTHDI